MIECKPYGASFLKPDTCIAKQRQLAEILPRVKEIEEMDDVGGINEIRLKTMPSKYLDVMKCRGCEIGRKIYKIYLEGGLNMDNEKTCGSCGKSYPRDENHFDAAYRASDKLTNDCKWCREKARVKARGGNKEQKKPETRTCPSCGKSKPLNTNHFHKRNDGFSARCKECRNKSKRIRRVEKKLDVPEGCVVLDLRGMPELQEKLEGWSVSHMRPVQDQIIYHLLTEKLDMGKIQAV